MRGFLIFVAVLVCGIGGLVAIGYLAPHSYVGICRDTKTQQRVPDKKCEPATSADAWVYYDSNADIPAVDQRAEDGSDSVPDEDEVRRGGVPEDGQQAGSNGGNDGNTGGGFAPGEGGGGSDVGVNSGDEGGDENVGSGGGGEDGE